MMVWLGVFATLFMGVVVGIMVMLSVTGDGRVDAGVKLRKTVFYAHPFLVIAAAILLAVLVRYSGWWYLLILAPLISFILTIIGFSISSNLEKQRRAEEERLYQAQLSKED